MRDVEGPRQEFLFKLPGFVEDFVKPHLNNPADITTVRTFGNIFMLTIPFAVLYYTVLPASHLIGCAYLGIGFAPLATRFILAMHFATHRKMFNKNSPLAFLNDVSSMFICAFFGIAPGVYKAHHCLMHHTQDNAAPEDLSSTEQYQRDNIFHFLHYWFRFLFFAPLELPLWVIRHHPTEYKLIAQVISYPIAYYGSIGLLFSTFPVQTLYVFVIPYLVISFALMFGNWSQHIFVEKKGANGVGNTYNCVGTTYNSIAHNDGYHVLHHLNSQSHWEQLPSIFLKKIDELDSQKTLSFEKYDFFMIGVFVMTGQLGKVADLTLTPTNLNREETIDLLKSRLRPHV